MLTHAPTICLSLLCSTSSWNLSIWEVKKCPLIPLTGILSKLSYFSKGIAFGTQKDFWLFPLSTKSHLSSESRSTKYCSFIGTWMGGMRGNHRGNKLQGKHGLMFGKYHSITASLGFILSSNSSRTLPWSLILLVFLIFRLCSFCEYSDFCVINTLYAIVPVSFSFRIRQQTH